MAHERTKVDQLLIFGVPRLDPIYVYPVSFQPGKGSITIVCAGRAWTAHWGATGKATIEEFFLACDSDYLARRLIQSTPMLPASHDLQYLGRILDAVRGAFKGGK